ncbi:MAG: hypothetical protein FJ254_01185 [Phycisphaerae bacterium]|nr:hypothetical protein [Phycisphaerae bacterium]
MSAGEGDDRVMKLREPRAFKAWARSAMPLLALGFAACSAAPGVQAPRGVPGCEASIDAWWADPLKARFEFVRVDRGEFEWGGGIDAFDRRTTWGVTLSPDDCAGLAADLAGVDWVGLSARQDSVTEDRAYVVIVTGKPNEHRVRAQADDAAIASLRKALMAIAARRLEGTLDELPKAGERFDQTRD